MPRRQVGGLTPEERQRWLYNPTTNACLDKNVLKLRPTNDGVCWLRKDSRNNGDVGEDDKAKKRSGSSSFSESIEVLGNTDDEYDSNWTEDEEFLLLKTFCKRSPICDQIGGCCGGDKGQYFSGQTFNAISTTQPLIFWTVPMSWTTLNLLGKLTAEVWPVVTERIFLLF